jgi:signal peptidase
MRSAFGWALVVVFVALSWPVQLGGHLGMVVVSGHSMDGTYRTGDLLMTWRHSRYDVGDVAVYRVPGDGAGHGMRVVHRIVARSGDGYVLQGDNRTTRDQWHPTDADMVGRPFARLAGGGLALRWLVNPLALALLCAVCVFFLVAKPNEPAESDEPAPAESTPQQP